MKLLITTVLAFSCLSIETAFASEEQFLKSIEGRWTGGGLVLRELGGQKVNVTCNMQSKANASRFQMDGSCRALVVISRGFNANVTASGARYSGTYVGVSGKPSTLVALWQYHQLRCDLGQRGLWRSEGEDGGSKGWGQRSPDQDHRQGSEVGQEHRYHTAQSEKELSSVFRFTERASVNHRRPETTKVVSENSCRSVCR